MDNWAVIGLGNAFRGDDGVGPYVIECLRAQVMPHIDCIENNGDMGSLVAEWCKRRVYLIDAVESSKSDAGTVVRVNGLMDVIPPSRCTTSSHGLNLAEALELSKHLDTLPVELEVYGICGSDFSLNAGLSTTVKSAADQVVQEILEKLNVQTGGL